MKRFSPAAIAAILMLVAGNALAADCVVSDTVVTADGQPRVGIKVIFYPPAPQVVNNEVLSASPVTATTDASGLLSVTLMQGTTVRVESVELGLRGQKILIPAASTANLRTLIAAYVSPGTPTPLKAIDIPVGVNDSGLTEITSAESVADALVNLNQTAGSGGGGSTPDATTTVKGKVELATDGENAANVVVQGNDSRLSNSRTPTAHATSHNTGGSDPLGGTLDSTARLSFRKNNTGSAVGARRQLDLIEGSNVSITVNDDSGGEEEDVTIAVPNASTSTKGAVQLGTSSDTSSGLAVQTNDTRLTDSRTPSSTLAHQSSHQSGGGDALSGNLDANGRVAVRVNSGGTPSVRRRLNIIAGSNVTVSQSDDSGSEEVDVTINASGGGGGLADGDYGDITVGSSSTTLTVDNDAITYAKVQNVSATDRLLGRVSASAGDIEEIPITDFVQTILDDSDAATVRTTIGAASGSGSASGTNTGDQTITLTGAVTGSGTGSFATTLANNVVGSSNITDGTVALADMANLAQDQFIGRTTASTGVPQTATITAAARTVLDDTTVAAMKTTLGAENALTFSTGLTRSTDTITVNTTQNIAKLSNLTSNGFVKTGSGDGTLSIDTSTYLTGNQTITASGDATGSGTTSLALTIANDAVTYAKMQNISATSRFLGRITAGAGDTEELTPTQATSLLNAMVGDSGSGGTKGLVPAPATGDATKCLSGAGTYVTCSGGGGLSDGDKGDITVSSSGATLTVDNDVVTYAKMQNVSATDKLLARVSSGSGDVEEVTFTDFAQSLVDDTDAATARATLGIPLWSKDYMADQMLAVGTSWPTTAMADLEVRNLVNVIAFDPSTSQGRGLEIVLPSGATTITLTIDAAAAASGFTTNNGIVMALDCRPQYGTGSFTQQAATAVTLTDNATIQQKTFGYTLSGLSLTAGTVALCELERLTANGSDTMTQDWRVAHIGVVVN